MLNETTALLSDLMREAAHPLVGEVEDHDPFMKLIGDAHLVLIGEASHGTHEFYSMQCSISMKRAQSSLWSGLRTGKPVKCRRLSQQVF